MTDHIKVHYKTFHGERRQFSFEVNINEKLCDIIPKICIEEDKLAESISDFKKWNYANQYKLISTRGYIRELNPLQTYREESVKDDEILIMLEQVRLNFSENNKGVLIHLECKNKVAFKLGGDEHQFAMTEQGFSFGKHYCEIILETEPYERSVIVGVSVRRTEFHLNSVEMKGFYGYVLSECKKVSNNAAGKVDLVDYGDITKIGDRIGIMMEFTNTGLDVSFYVNKINMGVAFKNLPLNVYFPSVVLGFDGTRVRVCGKVAFPDV